MITIYFSFPRIVVTAPANISDLTSIKSDGNQKHMGSFPQKGLDTVYHLPIMLYQFVYMN